MTASESSRFSASSLPGYPAEEAFVGGAVAHPLWTPATGSNGAPTPRVSTRSWQLRYLASLIGADVVAVLVAAYIAFLGRPATHPDLIVWGWALPYFVLPVLAAPTWFLGLSLAGAYRSRRLGSLRHDVAPPVVTTLEIIGLVAIGSYVARTSSSRVLFVAFFPALLLTALALRATLHCVLALARRRGFAVHRLMLAGERHAVSRLATHLKRGHAWGYVVVAAWLTDAKGSGPGPVDATSQAVPLIASNTDLVSAARAVQADSVAFAGHGGIAADHLRQMYWDLEAQGVGLIIAPDFPDFAGPRLEVTPVHGLPVLHVGQPPIVRPLSRWKLVYERACGIFLALMALPLALFLACAVLVVSGRPILFRQERIGQGGRPFWMYKFRTMVPDAEALLREISHANEHDGVLFKMRDDPRITPIGKWLRKYSLDELPQLINVLKGDMALVGPRPCLPSEMARFGHTTTLGQAAHRRFKAKPGLTGLWQVSGRADLPWEDAVRLDLWYIENWTPRLDLSILVRTVGVVLRGRGC